MTMNIKKIAAAAAAAIMALGVCTGVPAGTDNASPLAVTAEAAKEERGTLKAAVTYSGVSIDIKWNEVKNAAQYQIIVMYSTDAIPFSNVENMTPFAFDSVEAGGELSMSIPTIGLPLDINGTPVHYSVSVTPMTKDYEPVNDKEFTTLYFDSFDDLEKTKFNADGTINFNGDTSKPAEPEKTTETKTETKKESKKLPAPANFKAKKTSSSVTLSWDAVEGADMYRVYKYNEKTGKYEKYKDVKSTKCTVTGLKANTKYKFKITAYDKVNGKYVKGESSKPVSVTTKKK